MPAEILIIPDIRADGGIEPTALELLSASRIIADGRSVAAFLPAEVATDDSEWRGLDLDAVYRVEHPRLLEDYRSGIYDIITRAATELVRRNGHQTVLLPKTDMGSIVGPRLAARLGGAHLADCVDLTLNNAGRIAATRPVHGGNALAVYEVEDDIPQTVEIRPGAFEPALSRNDRQPTIQDVTLSDHSPNPPRPELLEAVAEEVAGIPLEAAETVVAGGRGLGGPEPFEELLTLCHTLNAALGASRAACDAGWLDHSHQVGLTGKKINPKTYITFGISGASQHMAGCSSARNIIAVNKDRSANIFAHSRFGVVGDWSKVLPAFMAACAELRDDD